MKRLLITGASGFLGWHCSQLLPPDWTAIGTYHRQKNGVAANTSPYPIDLTNQDAVWKMLKDVRPTAVFHLAAVSGTSACEKNPELTRQINVEATNWLAQMCADLKAKLLFTSSEQIFDGESGNYRESDHPNPKNKYGEQKWAAENAIQSVSPEAVILRIAVLFGQATPAAGCFLNQWVESWQKLLPVTAFHDEIRPFLSGSSCAAALFHLLQQDAEGVFHVGGATAFSRYEFAALAREILELPHAKIVGKSQREIEMPAFRPADLSLDCSKISGTGFTLENAADELKKIKPLMKAKPNVSLN